MKKKKTNLKSGRRKVKPRLKTDALVERREHPRLPICARVLWGQEERYFFSRDLSAAGVFLLSDHPPPIGQTLDLEIAVQFLPEPLRCSGRVVRHESQAGRAIGFAVSLEGDAPNLARVLRKLQSQMA